MLWAGDSRRKLLANIEAYGGDVALITVTAPGHKRMPTARDRVEWNLAAPPNYRRMSQRARQRVVRQGYAVNIITRTWEYQKRGALHVHVVLGAATASERAGAHRYLLELDRIRSEFDFGFVSDTSKSGKWRWKGLEIVQAHRAARYVAKYLSPLGEDGKPTLSETVTRRDVPPHVVYVSRKLTMKTGITMRYLRHVRLCHVRRIDPQTGEVLDQEQEHKLQPVVFAHAGPPDL